jgi:TonB family protein
MPDHDPITPHRAPFGSPREAPHEFGEVDEQVQRISGPRPVYPAALRAARVEGVVRLRMVVDTLGRVEPGSLVVVASSHPGFEAAAKEAIAQSRFSAARVGGVSVRQLVQQSVRFAIES